MAARKHIPNLLIAEAVGNKALKALSDSRRVVKVRGVFDHALYIGVGRNVLINVIRNRSYVSPSSVLLSDSEHIDFSSIGIKEGMKVEASDSTLYIDDVLTVKFNDSNIWFSPPPPKKNALIGLESISLNLRILRDVIYTAPSREGLIPLLENVELYGPLKFFLQPQEPTLSERARPYIDRLMWGLFGGDSSMVVSGASSILGLGPGLTPSCDDFLTGLMLSLTVGGNALFIRRKIELSFYKRVSAEICRAAKEKTTIYSQSFLNQARYGEGPIAAVELIHGLLTKDAHQVATVSKTVINMGETSGADFAIGIYYGIRFLLSKLERIDESYGIA